MLTQINILQFQNEAEKIHDKVYNQLTYRPILFIVFWQLKYL